MNKYQYISMQEYCTNVTDGTHATPKEVQYGYPLVTSKNLNNGRLDLNNTYLISESDYNEINTRSKVDKNDVLISMIGTVGLVCFVDRQPDFAIKNVGLLKNKDEFHGKWLYYYLSSPEGQYSIQERLRGTTQQYIPLNEIRKLPVKVLFSMDDMKKIVNFLSSLDDKIELNTQINHNLEEQAKAIFKSWFVDFSALEDHEFYDNNGLCVPVGWDISCLSNVADYLNGLAMQKYRPDDGDDGYPVLKIKELRQGMCDKESERCSSFIKPEYIVHDGDVVFSWSGSLLVDFWCGGDCGLNQHLFKVTSTKFDKWFYYSWTLHHLNEFIAIAADKATTMGHIKRENLQAAVVLIPPKNVYDEIGKLLGPIYESIVRNRVESKRLAQLRDALLPKLMSGEIDVSEVQV